MRVFLLSVVAAAAIAVGSAYVLSMIQEPVSQAFTTTGARISPDY